MTADSMATAVSVLGADRGIEFVERKQGVAALIVGSEGRRVESTCFHAESEALAFFFNELLMSTRGAAILAASRHPAGFARCSRQEDKPA